MFSETTVETPSTEVPKDSVDALATKLFSITNEKGEPKYDSLYKAVDALAHAQDYIPKLKNEKEQLEAEVVRLREEAAKRQSLEETISRLTTSRPAEVPAPTSEAPKSLDENSVLSLVQRELAQREQVSVTQANAKMVADTMSAKYGDKAKAEIAAKAQELGMNLKDMENFAYSNPKAFLSWFNASPSASTVAPVRSSVHLPDAPVDNTAKHPGKSLLRGASSKEQAAYMRQIKAEIYAKHGIDE
jgi:hypothetical protein